MKYLKQMKENKFKGLLLLGTMGALLATTGCSTELNNLDRFNSFGTYNSCRVQPVTEASLPRVTPDR